MEEWTRRVRAAAAYAELRPGQLAAKLGMSESTLNRTFKKGAAGFREYEFDAFLARVAKACELPVEFFTIDFALLEDLDPERLRRSPEEATRRMQAEIDRFGQAINMLELSFSQPTEESDDPPDVVRHELEGESPTEEDPAQQDEDGDRPAEGGGA